MYLHLTTTVYSCVICASGFLASIAGLFFSSLNTIAKSWDFVLLNFGKVCASTILRKGSFFRDRVHPNCWTDLVMDISPIRFLLNLFLLVAVAAVRDVVMEHHL